MTPDPNKFNFAKKNVLNPNHFAHCGIEKDVVVILNDRNKIYVKSVLQKLDIRYEEKIMI